MFIPCDHCLRKHATQTLEGVEAGQRELLRLCNDCYRKEKENSFLSPHAPSKLSTEEDIAQGLVANLIPRELPDIPGYDLGVCYRPAKDVHADYYDFFRIDGDHLGLIVANVSGRGVPAAIIMTETKALVKSEAARSHSPAETLARVNRVLYQDIRRGMFVTNFYAVLSLGSGTMTCVSAGHNPMVLWRKASNTCHLVNPNGLALGIDKGPLFERTLKEQKVKLSKGDRFTLYTDGVIESMNQQSEQFGQNRLYLRMKQLADTSSGKFLSRLVAEIEAHQGDAPQEDDLMILTGRYEGGT